MVALPLHELHHDLSARFLAVNGCEVVEHYGDPAAEHTALRSAAGLADLGYRSRLCLTGVDRVRFLHGQVTNNVKDLRPGTGCCAALVTAKGRLESDLQIFALADELLLDFEPGLTPEVSQRLEKFIIADDVQILDAAPHYGLLSVQGPLAADVINHLNLGVELPARPLTLASLSHPVWGDLYLVNHPHFSTPGFDLFIPTATLAAVWEQLVTAVRAVGGRPCGWQAWETARFEAGIPRFGLDMDATNLAPETGMESRAISYSKGCYIGQEVIARIRTYGQVAKALRGLRLADQLTTLPLKGDRLFHAGKEVGVITSALASPTLHANFAFGYVRKEANVIGTPLTLQSAAGESPVQVVTLPFQPFTA